MADEKELQVKIRFISDVSGVKDARKEAESLKNSGGQSNQVAAGFGKAADQATRAATALAAAGAIMNAGMMKAATSYISAVGSSEAVSKQWMIANQGVEESFIRIGRSIASSMLPNLQKAAGLMNGVADWAEKNPQTVKTATDVSTGLVVGGSILGGLGIIGKILGQPNLVKTLLKSPVTAGVGVGLAANEGLASVTGGKSFDAPAISKVLMGMLSGISPAFAGMLYRFREQNGTGNQVGFQSMGNYAAAATGSAGSASSAPDPLRGGSPGQVIAYAQYYRQEENALRAHLITLARANRDFQIQQEYEVQDYTRQRSRSVRDFSRQENQNVFEYNRQRAIAVRDFNISILRSEQDYQKQRTRSGEDFQFQLWDIARSGDAFAYMQATRQFNLQQSRGEEDYNIQRQRQVEDFTRQQTDQEDSFTIQRNFRLQAFQISQADQEEDFTIRRDREAKQRALQILDQEQDFAEQKRLRRQAITDTLNDMADGTTKAGILMRQFTEGMVGDMQYLADGGARLNDYFSKLNIPGGSVPSRDVGGYVDRGLYQMHDNEFVLNASTTKALEQLGGGGLTQGGVLGMLGRGGGGSITINDQRRFDSRLSADDRQSIRRENVNMLQEVFGA